MNFKSHCYLYCFFSVGAFRNWTDRKLLCIYRGTVKTRKYLCDNNCSILLKRTITPPAIMQVVVCTIYIRPLLLLLHMNGFRVMYQMTTAGALIVGRCTVHRWGWNGIRWEPRTRLNGITYIYIILAGSRSCGRIPEMGIKYFKACAE